MYSYYYLKTKHLSEGWSTAQIQNLLRSFSAFEEKPNGRFTSQSPFLDISLMKVSDPNSWSDLDFDPVETNYLSIVTSDGSNFDQCVQRIFRELEQLLDCKICADDC